MTLTCVLAGLLAEATLAQTGSWQTLVDMPTPRRLLAAALHGGKVYTFGGCGSPCYDPTLHPSTFEETRLEVFAPASASWSPRAAMPAIFFSGAAAALGDHIYLAGGSVTGNVLQRYHPASDSWASMAPMPTSRFGLALVALGGKLYAVGGSGPTGALEVYDPGSDSWNARAPMPTPRVFLAAAAVGGRIYAAGGSPDCCGNSQTGALEIYDPGTGSWTTGPPLPVAQQASAAAALDGKVYVFGGFIPGVGARDNVFAYDPQSGNWTAGAAMPTARDQAPAASDGQSAYVLGGSVDCHCQALNAHERFTVPGDGDDDDDDDEADLEITKTNGVDVISCLDPEVTYTITVSNLGPDPVTGARVHDDFPPALGLPALDETVDLAAGDSISFTIRGTLAADACGSLTNTATVEPPAGVLDPVSANNSATDSDPIFKVADLEITKTNGLDDVPGCTDAKIPYTVTVRNLGPCPVSGARVHDVFPPQFLPALPDLNELIDLAVGASTDFMVTGILDPAARGSLENTATVELPECFEDPDPANNSATDSDLILEVADLSVTKTNGTDEVFVCEEVIYDLRFENAGPCPVVDASYADTPPPELGLPPLGGLLTLAAGAFTDIAATGVLDPVASGVLANTATIDPPAGVSDPVPANNSATDADPIRRRTGDPMITKECTPTEVFRLSDVTCIIVVTNPGPDDVFGAIVNDDFPGNSIIDVIWTCAAAGDATCAPSGSGDIEDVVGLPAGGSVTYTATGTVGPWARDEICNTAHVLPPAPQCFDDLDPANNSATACVDVLLDCNGNHTDDAVDIALGTSDDVNGDEIPDECQVGHADWTFSGLAEGGTVVVTVEGVPGLYAGCTVVTPTNAGESPATVAANNLAAIDADLCLAPQALTGMVMGATVWLEGFLLSQRRVSIEITDPGLDYDIPVVKIPTLSAFGLGLTALLLAAAGAGLIARGHRRRR